MKNLVKLIVVFFFFISFSCKQKTIDVAKTITAETITEFYDIEKVEPPNWWVGFKSKELQLLIKHPDISRSTPEINYTGVSINKVHTANSPNYLFIDLNIAESAKSGKFNITFKFENGVEKSQTYELKPREKLAEDFIGFNSSDALYLITPDRFANADISNDVYIERSGFNENGNKVSMLKEATINRADDYARHGGDIKGITNHLDYIHDMGFTAVWSCPLLTNNMPSTSYHGYAMTNFYEIDPRFGTLADYKELASKGRDKGIKLIMDQVANHCGSGHWWIQDLPFKDWLNYQKNYENKGKLITSNHRRTSNQDIYASKKDKKEMTDGWFVSTMPDLNQRNPFMAKYIIQNSIWWIETVGLGGIRQDTYPYPDKEFMSNWAGSIMTEYPNFSIVGEEWSYNPLLIGYWQEGANNKDGYDSNLKSPMDFAMQRNIVEALNEKESWDKGLVKMYEGLANDFHYAMPKDIMIFPDNHDMSRIFTQLKEDVIHTKMALGYMLSLPRIPQIYYGTEILMNDTAKPGDHGLIRTDFPGGWEGDTINAFTSEGLTAQQKEMQSYVKKVLNYRKHSKAIHEGETIHFAPENGVYVLFRIVEEETVVHIINKNKAPIDLDLSRFEEVNLNGRTLKNIISDEEIEWKYFLKLKEKGNILLTTKL